ncbi:MAG: asparagine synthase (glutamine-hydrolyzing) [Reyranella sp.]|uniref:asparagine synthase (glutamine-hydrolyzing) n=1 Tax=Reyranella sp. TaxID=1929291 RepID=UPI0012130561|nr:asparagine synthase (glutamine-hydrolyzing) [Reyranella sp.]TAJ85282.1 MAG: asparagine synthase (glutamine-hydrolyzing) [Reyranella sp.]TBR28611.1 MAG: asparagine synthase (glutamine-hydrolyzing) [Reyranella sp.]
MCGIAGIHAYLDVAPPVDRGELVRMSERMVARGPDGSGLWVSGDGRTGFGHLRLAIIDLSEGGAQPMHASDGRLTITFNGEIYNYRELRAELQARGRTFRSGSDTEVLLQLYAEYGAAMVGRLRGMFAFGLWDADKRTMLLARDPLGIKPLYWADDGWTLRFASQAKALLAGGAVSRDPDPAGIVGFHLFGSVPEPFTVWRSIQSLPAGTMLTVDATGPGLPQRYYDVATALTERAAPAAAPGDSRRRVAEAVRDSVRHHLVADVPVAVFLSAGIDSGVLLGTMAGLGARDVTAVTLGFAEFEGLALDEAPLAAEVAARYGARHIVRTVDRAEFERDLPAIMDAMDLPTVDGINTWFVAKAAREAGIKVALSGLGADECFGGYPSFTDVPRSVHWLRPVSWLPGLGALARWGLSGAIAAGLRLHPKAAGVLQYGGNWAGAYLLRRGVYMPWELDDVLDPALVQEGLRRLAPLSRIAAALEAGHRLGDFDRVAALETSLYMRNQLLRDADWAGMSQGVEIRVPFVDPFFIAALPPGPVLAGMNAKDAIAEVPSPPLPDSVRHRRKTGFSTPLGRWLQDAAGAPRQPGIDFSAASRAWALNVWRAGWTGPAAA